jgi:ribonucleotide reductase beta subunit family protein with ferritin-like domain
MENKTVPE